MSRILIVSKTRMNQGMVCVGGVDVDNQRSVRLLNVFGYHESAADCPYNIGEVWECSCVKHNQRSLPHSEDFKITTRKCVGTLSSVFGGLCFENIIKDCVPFYCGDLMLVFEGKLKHDDGKGSLFITKDNVPSFSTCFWKTDRDMKKSIYNDRVRFVYNNGEVRWGFNIPYVGLDFSDVPEIIPAGSLVRLSLANWWRKDGDEEDRCYLQLSNFRL